MSRWHNEINLMLVFFSQKVKRRSPSANAPTDSDHHFIRPSPIQTILSALESHQILPKKARGLRFIIITADWEFHPTPKDNNI